jgi:hypothetical protein
MKSSPNGSTAALQPQPAPAHAFPWPKDSQAWWSFSACLLGGWALSFGARPDRAGLSLAASALGLFLASDWLSHLAGRSRDGEVDPAPAFDLRGIGLLLLAAAGLGSLLGSVPRADSGAWLQAITAHACLVALMFILRLEWRALDGRLLYLSHLILTLPVLGLGFAAWGVGSAAALGLWVLPALYFPAQALFTQYWMEGPAAPATGLSVLAVPLLGGVLLEALRGGWSATAFFGFYLLRVVLLLQARRNSGQRVPGFAEATRLGREIWGWNVAAVVVWGLSQL